MKATPTHGRPAPTSAHGTALTARSSNQHIYPLYIPARSPAVPEHAKSRQVPTDIGESQVDHLPHGTGRRLGNSDSTRSIRAVRVSTRQSVIISAPYDLRMGQTSEGHRISRARAIPSRHHSIIGNRDKRPGPRFNLKSTGAATVPSHCEPVPRCS